jgi:hypothetical protein
MSVTVTTELRGGSDSVLVTEPQQRKPQNHRQEETSKALTDHSDREVRDYSFFAEGDMDPFMQKEIHKLIIAAEGFIVYLDQDLSVQWAFTNKYGVLPTAYGDIVSKVSYLEALPEPTLTGKYRQTFQIFLAEVLKYVLETKDHAGRAYALLDRAENYYIARNRELARVWYLKAATVGLAGVLAATFLTMSIYGRSLYLLCAIAGALGAWVSVLLPNKTMLDAQAGRSVIGFEGVACILLGTFAALFLTFAIQANLF